jgi:hypothetical protein
LSSLYICMVVFSFSTICISLDESVVNARICTTSVPSDFLPVSVMISKPSTKLISNVFTLQSVAKVEIALLISILYVTEFIPVATKLISVVVDTILIVEKLASIIGIVTVGVGTVVGIVGVGIVGIVGIVGVGIVGIVGVGTVGIVGVGIVGIVGIVTVGTVTVGIVTVGTVTVGIVGVGIVGIVGVGIVGIVGVGIVGTVTVGTVTVGIVGVGIVTVGVFGLGELLMIILVVYIIFLANIFTV